MDPERSGQQGGGEATFIPAESNTGARGGSGSSGTSAFRNPGSNKSTNTGGYQNRGDRGGLEIKVLHTNTRTGT